MTCTPGTRVLRSARRAFTLTELLVVIAIIGIVGALTVVAFQGVANESRVASAKNAIVSSLDRARGIAMKSNNYVMVVFRPVVDENNVQTVEIVTTEWTGVSSGPCVTFVSTPLRRPVDQFRPSVGVPIRTLPRGIGVASPTFGYADNAGNFDDEEWFSLSNLRSAAEAPGNMIAVLYSPAGTVTSRNPQSDSFRQYVDFNGDGLQNFQDQDLNYDLMMLGGGCAGPQVSSADFDGSTSGDGFFAHEVDVANNPPVAEEPYVRVAPFLAVYDDDEARSQLDTSGWNDFLQRRRDISVFINEKSTRIHFNRYSGVVMR